MKKVKLVILTLAVLCLSSDVFAQEKPELVTQIEKTFAEREPKWKIDRRHVQTSPPVIHLKSAQGDALVYVWIMDSAKTVGEVFEGSTIAFGNSMGAKGKKVYSTSNGRFESSRF